MLPSDVMKTSIPELMSFLEGYRNRLKNSWEQTRLIAYTVHSLPYVIFGKSDDMQMMEDWMPLWFDASPEERKLNEEKERKVKGMIAEKDIEHYRSLGINI
jgi:hypothetical protein